jgi:hypothetical protein
VAKSDYSRGDAVTHARRAGLLFIRACFPPNLVLSTKRTCFAGNWEMGDPGISGNSI